MRDERLPEHFPRDLARFVGGFHEMHAALETVFESPFAASARVDLRFDDDVLLAEFARDLPRLPPPVRATLPGRVATPNFSNSSRA